VQQQPVGNCKLLAANGTREVLLAGVDADVSTQAARQRKRPVASAANVRTPRLSRATAAHLRHGNSGREFVGAVQSRRLVIVDFHVSLQIVGARKAAAAPRALEVLQAAVHEAM